MKRLFLLAALAALVTIAAFATVPARADFRVRGSPSDVQSLGASTGKSYKSPWT
jgi:hypothetical protein